MRAHLFGAASSPSCATFALRQTAKDHGKLFSPEVADTAVKCFYLDDWLTSTNGVETAVKLIKDLRNFLQKSDFRLTMWISSSKAVKESIPLEERAKVALDLCLRNAENKVLGMNWNIEKDVLTFEVSAEDEPATQRFVLSATIRLFDPFELVAPVIIEARLIFRDHCKLNVGWDEPLPTSLQSRWTSWINSLQELRKICIKCCFQSDDDVDDVQMHVFANASVVARGASFFVRMQHESGRVDCCIVMAKALLASSQNKTISRMELEAAIDAVKLACLVKKDLGLHCKCTYWTDSPIVFKSIQAVKRNPSDSLFSPQSSGTY